MRVLCATSWNTPCGIADYAEQAQRWIRSADRSISVDCFAEALNPDWAWERRADYDALWLNHHEGLHSRWEAGHLEQWHHIGVRTLVTYHDTFDGQDRPNSAKARALLDYSNAFVVHEPVTDLPGAVYLRQGVHPGMAPKWDLWSRSSLVDNGFLAYPQQPILASVGFNFGWKNFDRVAKVSAECGWALLLLSNDAKAEDEARWRSLNPNLCVIRQFLPQAEAIAYLASADATIFAYECANAGTSGAIRQGIAARKPVIAWAGCRQFRDLHEDDQANGVIDWCDNFEDLPWTLTQVRVQPVDPGIVYLATRDSWISRGRAYAALLRGDYDRL